MRIAATLVLLLGLAILLGVGWAWQRYQGFLETPVVPGGAETVLTVRAGDTLRDVVTSEPIGSVWSWPWKVLARQRPSTILVGEYRVPPATTPDALMDLLASGDVISYPFTLIEGWTFRDLRAALARTEDLDRRVEPAWSDAEVLAAADVDVGHPEGWFLPETYRFVRGDSDLDVLRRAHHAMRAALDAAWEGRADGLPFEAPYELLTAASIIEKETAVDAERRQVAGVIVRRLQRGMRLEVDPTIIYGMGEAFDGDIRTADLRRDNPYNTYTRDGLPPTPIAMPRRASLEAAAHPADGDALFFVADGQGGHVFSATYAEHQAAVRAYLAKQRQGEQ